MIGAGTVFARASPGRPGNVGGGVRREAFAFRRGRHPVEDKIDAAARTSSAVRGSPSRQNLENRNLNKSSVLRLLQAFRQL